MMGFNLDRVQHPIILIPTHNEVLSITQLVDELLGLNDKLHILIIDDSSPDGTGNKIQNHSEFNHRLFLLTRPSKLGLGTAYREGYKWALERTYNVFIQMDADRSHDPHDVNRMIEEIARGVDVVIGSRYIHGVRVLNWPLSRLFLSTFAGAYTRIFTRLPFTDPTSGFKAIHRDSLAKLSWNLFTSGGYSFQIEQLFFLWKTGARCLEIPIIFTDRHEGQSKMSRDIAIEAASRVLQLAWSDLRKKDRIEVSEKMIPFIYRIIIAIPILNRLFQAFVHATMPKTLNRYGVTLAVDPDDTAISLGLLLYLYERDDIPFSKSLLKQGMNVLDIGANIGIYTTVSAKIVGGEGRVFAFEPLEEARNYLNQNIHLNGLKNVTVFPIALSNKEGKATLSRNLYNRGDNSLYRKGNEVEVELKTLDSLIGDVRIDAIKMDVQGAEMDVLEGAKNTIQKYYPLVFLEADPDMLRMAGRDPLEVDRFFESLGYTKQDVRDHNKLFVPKKA